MLACWHPDPMQRPILKHIIDFMKQYEIELTTREASMFIKKYSNKRACEVRYIKNITFLFRHVKFNFFLNELVKWVEPL